MQVEKYKMIYIKNTNKNLEDVLKYYYIRKKVKDEIESDNIRILGKAFVKNNKNKAKLIINNKKYNLKEFINSQEIKDDKIKINMILNKDLSNGSHMFENFGKLMEISFYDNSVNIDDISQEFKEYFD